MKNIIYKIFILIGLTSGLSSLTSCQEELSLNKVEEEISGVTIRIPLNTKFINSRAEGENTAPVVGKEGDIKNIYLFVISTVNREKAFEILKLTEPQKSTDGSNTYLDYKVPLETGNYKFHLVANFDDYLFANVPQMISTEDQLVELVKNFTTDKELKPGNLPMYCFNASVNGNTTQNEIYVEKGKPITVMGPLTFLCSKIRYTILFDARNGGFSSGFGEKRIRFLVNDNDLPNVQNYGTENEYDGFEDITYKYLKDADFSGEQNNWSGTRFTNHRDGVAEHYNTTFDSYQTLNNMEPGIYNLEAQGFYRNGSMASAWTRYLFGTQQLLAKIYIKNQNNNNITEAPFRSLYSEYYGNLPNMYPDDTKGANDAFNTEGKYNGNGVTYTLESKGGLQVGVRKTSSQLYDWTCFDNFKLYYKPLQKNNSSLRKPIPLDKFTITWEPKPNPEYPTSATDELTSFSGTDDEWIDLGYKAWQGVTYLPENISTAKENKTVLHFPYCFGNQTTPKGEKTLILFDNDDNDDSNPKDNAGSPVKHGLERGMMYDIVIKVVKSTQEEDEFTLNVCVIDWNYKPEESIW